MPIWVGRRILSPSLAPGLRGNAAEEMQRIAQNFWEKNGAPERIPRGVLSGFNHHINKGVLKF